MSKDSKEKQVRLSLRNAAWLAGSAILFLGWGLKSVIVHQTHPNVYFTIGCQELMDYSFLFISAFHAGTAAYLFGKASMLMNGINPEKS